ncbi:carbohydrate esterase family 5 protein [Xylariaceae sp. FL0016]|nr:carbohydrate esterase family 5 protein [Xylariaceae sp. FL0016]
MLFKALALTSLLQATAASPLALHPRACEDVHVFIARGSEEPYPGRQESLVDVICDGLSSCGYEDITYPATFSDYCDSVSAGVANGIAQLTAYAKSCPNSELVLTGYSQGAQLVADILGGGGGNFGDCTETTTKGLSMTTSPGNKIVAATFFGDVRHAPSQSYNTGSGASGKGIYPRTGSQLSSLNKWSSVLRSWCLSGDPVCAGGSDINAHTSYFNVFSDEAGAWVKTKL